MRGNRYKQWGEEKEGGRVKGKNHHTENKRKNKKGGEKKVSHEVGAHHI
jgi:hypothetical protein